MAATREVARDVMMTFRVSPQERRELLLLARAERTSRSELLRELVQKAVRRATETNREEVVR